MRMRVPCPEQKVLSRCDSSVIGTNDTWSRNGRGALQYEGFRTKTIWLSRVQLLMMNGPAPNGLLANWSPRCWIAAGDATYGIRSTESGKTALAFFKVILSVTAST